MDWIIPTVIAVVMALAGIYVSMQCYQVALRRGKKEGADEFLRSILAGGYDQRVKAFKALNSFAKSGGVVFVGDSITQDYPVWEYFPDQVVYNRGIGGDTSVGLLLRLNESLFDLSPRAVVLLIGTNDLALLHSSPEAIAENIRRIIQEIQARLPECLILLESVYPVIPPPDGPNPPERDNRDIRAINLLISRIPGIEYINFYSLLADSEGNLRSEFTVEGLHINQNGYVLISKELRKRLFQ
jgi:lysophospholipase L1-like esterase